MLEFVIPAAVGAGGTALAAAIATIVQTLRLGRTSRSAAAGLETVTVSAASYRRILAELDEVKSDIAEIEKTIESDLGPTRRR